LNAVDATLPLIISGSEYARQTFSTASPFYPGYTYPVASSSVLDVSKAIGAVRRAEVLSLSDRQACLVRAADLFAFDHEDIDWSVRMTGMPARILSSLYEEIPDILRSIPLGLSARFESVSTGQYYFTEIVQPGVSKIYYPLGGFCYAITPGNDPRATAIVAANLVAFGIPFIIRASIRDRAAPRLFRALIAAGLDPGSCNLIYLDREDPNSLENHSRLVHACSLIWTFGPPAAIDPTLRYSSREARPVLDLSNLDLDLSDPLALTGYLHASWPEEIARRLTVEDVAEDLFSGKRVIRHAAGNCAAIIDGDFAERGAELLYRAIGYPVACTATKSIMAIGSQGLKGHISGYLESLVVGDPLDLATQVGYIDPRCLDLVDELRRSNAVRCEFFGGERLSQIQGTPLLVCSQEDCPDFFAQEIPAYVLAMRSCTDLPEAVGIINHYTADEPRLGVSLLNFSMKDLPPELLTLRAHTILHGKLTSTLLPGYHEGNDYALLLTRPKFLWG
jgi:acyl-CoA reductase-like NAD-dependent aldehyde dehydrogenase